MVAGDSEEISKRPAIVHSCVNVGAVVEQVTMGC